MSVERIKTFFRKAIVADIVVLFCLGALSWFWFRGDNLIGGGDFGMPNDWGKYLKLMFYIWDETLSMGMFVPRQVALLVPYTIAGALLQFLGFSLVFIEKIFFYSWFTGSGLSMYFLCWVLGMKRIGRLLAAVFYMLNPFSLIIIWRVSHGLIQMPYAFAPLVLGLFLYGLKTKKGFSFVIFTNFIWLFSTASAYANPRMVIIHWLPIGVWAFLHFLFLKKERFFLLKYTLSFFVFWIFLNFYWLFPFVKTMSESMASAHLPFLLPDEAELKLTSVSFFEAIRMLGYWSLKDGYKGEPYYPYWQFYSLPWINLISWLIPVLVILGLANKETRRLPLKFFCLFIIIFGLLGINGANPPIGSAIVWFYRIFPPLMLLARFNFLFFGMPTYLIFCILVGYGSLLIHELITKKASKHIAFIFLLFFCFLLSVVLVFPFWNGEVIRSPTKLFPGERYKIPSYWLEAKEWLNEQNDFFRVLPLPMSKTYNVALNWGEGYSGGDLTRWFAKQPVINANTGSTFEVPMVIGENIEIKSDFRDMTNLLGFLNVKYLILRRDTRWEFIKRHEWWFAHTPENITEFIKSQKNLSLEKSFGELEFYRVSDSLNVPKIYAAQRMVVIDGGPGDLPALSQFLHPELKDGFLLIEQESQRFAEKPGFIAKNPLTQKKEEAGLVIYEIDIKEGGKYKMMFADNEILPFYQSKESWQITVDQENILEAVPKIYQDNLLSLGEVELSSGKHRILLHLPPTINLVSNPSFEEEVAGFEYSTDAIDGKKSLSLISKMGARVVSIPIDVFKPGISYYISLSTKNISGEQPFILLWENLDDLPEPSFNPQFTRFGYKDLRTFFSRINLPAGNLWQSFNFIFKPNLFSKNVGIALVSNSDGKKKTANLFDKLEVRRVFDRSLILQRVDMQQSSQQTVPEIEFKRISPVKYKVEIKNALQPFFLIFSEAFHSQWQISTAGEHFMANGYANGWYITKTGDYEVEIYFKNQSILNFGRGVSILCFVLSIIYILLKKTRLIGGG